MTKIINDKEIIIQYLKNKGISKNSFYKKTGLSVGFLDSGKSLGVDKLRQIIDKYHDLDLNLFFPEVKILTETNAQVSENNLVGNYNNKYTPSNQRILPKLKHASIADFGSAVFSITEEHVLSEYVIPEFEAKQVNFLFQMEGETMAPKYVSGDLLAATIVRDPKFIQWNKPHIVSTKDQGILVKRLLSAKGNNIEMVSENKAYPPFNVALAEIKGIAIVVGVIRVE